MPDFMCAECSLSMVMKERPSECPMCGSKEITHAQKFCFKCKGVRDVEGSRICSKCRED